MRRLRTHKSRIIPINSVSTEDLEGQMKPANFDYFAPTSLVEALALLEQHGDEAKILAGGQSLMPLINMLRPPPNVFIDITRLSGLPCIPPGPEGGLAGGPLPRQRVVER